MCPPCGEGWSQPCRNYIGWAGLLWNRMEKLPQRMGCWTDSNIEPHISVSNVLSWTLQAHQSIMGISSAHKSSSSQHHKTSTPNQLHADSALHEYTFSVNYPTHQINFNLSIDVQHLPRRCYINNSQIYWAMTTRHYPPSFNCIMSIGPHNNPGHYVQSLSSSHRQGDRIWETDLSKVTQHSKATSQGKTPWLHRQCS